MVLAVSPIVNSAVVGSLSLGGLFALIGIGYATIYRTTRVVNFAQGDFLAVGAFLLSTFLGVAHGNHAIAIPLAIAADAIVGVLIYTLIVRRLVGTDEFSVIVLTFGISIAIESTLTLIYGSSNRFATVGLPTGRINWAGFQFSWLDVAAAACAVIGVVAILALMRFTRWGVDSRALAENPSLAADFGIRTGAVGAVAWALGTGAAALAGIVYGATTNVSLSLADVGLVTLPGIMLGGMDSVGGALVGGVVMGVLISLVTYVGGPDVATIAGYGALLVVLIFLPQGLFGLRRSRVV